LISAGLRPNPAAEAYSAPPDPLAVFNGPTSKGRAGDKGGGGRRERAEEVREGKGGGASPQYFGLEPPLHERRERRRPLYSK